jgi:hypothetical protein
LGSTGLTAAPNPTGAIDVSFHYAGCRGCYRPDPVRFVGDAHTPPGPAAQQTPPRIPTEQLKGTAQLRGRVVSSAGAVSGAVVRLTSANTRARSVTTTDDGRFVFDEVGAGNYRLVVAKSGLMTTTFGAGADGRPIVIADGVAIDRGDLELFAGASIQRHDSRRLAATRWPTQRCRSVA